MSYREYQKLLTIAKNKMSPYLNNIGLFYDEDIQKFIGFNDYEVILIEFEEFSRDTELAINFKRYTNCLDESYIFTLPNKKNLYGCRTINFSHWKYYPEEVDKKDKEYLNKQLEMITDEMLGQIKLKLEPIILTDYPVDVYIEEKYLEITDEMAYKITSNGYAFDDEWIEMNEERVGSMPWWSNLCKEQYLYSSKKREELLSYKTFYYEMKQRYEINMKKYQKEVKAYLSQFKNAKFIKPKYKYYFIQEIMKSEKGYYVEAELKKHGFERQDSIGCHRYNQEAFYSKRFDIEIYFIIYDGIRWAFSFSMLNEYGLLTVQNIEADCESLCLIEDSNFKEGISEAIEKLLKALS